MINTSRTPNSTLHLIAGSFLCFLAACSTTQPAPPPSVVQHANVIQNSAEQTSFASPQEAVDALVVASRSDKKGELLKILGPNADKLVSSGDNVADQEGREKFVTAYDKAHRIENTPNGRAVLLVGEEEWPMPIPLVRSNNSWRFDATAGEEEILNRRIGRNELNVVGVCRAYVEAQEEFAAQSSSGEYAQRFHSHDGQHDGLYWPTAEGEDESPFGSLIADATVEGYKAKTISKHNPYHGYFYQILKGQGQHASGGAKDYMVNGHMMNGFALIAFPARYGDSGVMTFVVNQNGIVYEKNLGPATTKIARHIKQFDPDSSWNIVR